MTLSGCASTRQAFEERRERADQKEQIERIVERQVTVPQEVIKIVKELISLPESLTSECVITYAKNRTVGEYVRVANYNTPSLEDCRNRMKQIDDLRKRAIEKGAISSE